MFFGSSITTMVATLLAVLLAITFHETAHGFVAYKLGDPTAKNQGRLTLNPLAHLDPVGALLMFVAGFGWAKPVPVNPFYFNGDRTKGMMLVSVAGPVTNLVLSFIYRILRLNFVLNKNKDRTLYDSDNPPSEPPVLDKPAGLDLLRKRFGECKPHSREPCIGYGHYGVREGGDRLCSRRELPEMDTERL